MALPRSFETVLFGAWALGLSGMRPTWRPCSDLDDCLYPRACGIAELVRDNILGAQW